MITRTSVIMLLAMCLGAGPAAAQTASELLQQGIYKQEAVGDLDAAITIFRQVLGSAPPREIGAQAQYRLADSLLRKGDLNGAGQEFQTLARVYPDQSALVASLSARMAGAGKRLLLPPVPPRREHLTIMELDLFDGLYDWSHPITIQAPISRVEWINPRAILYLQGGGVTYAFTLHAPRTMVDAGITRNTFKVGDVVTARGPSAKANTLPDGRTLDKETMHAKATQVTLPDGQVLDIFTGTDLAPPRR